jgi:short-subunit dehydrogenase
LTWALVTGACSGIGLELARGLAARGYSLVLVSDRPAELRTAALEMTAQQGVTAHAIALDLSQPEAARALYDRTKGLGVEIEVLVNNAGFLLFGEVADADPERLNALLQLHVTTPTLLAHHFGRDMRVRRRGDILIMSSASTWRDFPGVAVYGSTKRYLRSLATALREEMRPWGINVTCLAPGAVATGLYGRTTGAAARATRLGLLSDPAMVAKAGLRGMFRGKALVLPGPGAKLMAVGAAITPRWLIHLLRMRTSLLSRP